MASDLPEDFGATPFLKFFHGEWQRLLEAIEVPYMADCSWDRKAAYLYWNKGEDMSRLQNKSKVLEGEREQRLAELWAGKISDRFGSGIAQLEVIKEEFMTKLRIGFPGKGWDSGKVFNLFVIVLSPGRKPNRYEAEAMALDKSIASFDNVEALLEALSGVVTNG